MDDSPSARAAQDASSARNSPSVPPANPVLRIVREIHHRFYSLPGEVRKRAEQEHAEKKKRYNRFMSGYMTGTYWKKNKRLTVSFCPSAWETLSRFAETAGLSPTAACRQAALAHIEQAKRAPPSPAGAASPREDPPGHPPQPDSGVLARRADSIEKAIERVGININQAIRHIHTKKDTTLREIRACHDLLKDLKANIRRMLTGGGS